MEKEKVTTGIAKTLSHCSGWSYQRYHKLTENKRILNGLKYREYFPFKQLSSKMNAVTSKGAGLNFKKHQQVENEVI